MFLKLKRNGKIKGRAVADVNRQRDFITKGKASSPTIATKEVIIICVIDAREKMDVAIIDIPNTFIQTRVKNVEDMANIIIQGV